MYFRAERWLQSFAAKALERGQNASSTVQSEQVKYLTIKERRAVLPSMAMTSQPVFFTSEDIQD